MGRLLAGLLLFTLLLPLTALAGGEERGQVTAQIVGGEAAGAGEWPSQVALVRTGYEDPIDGQFCSGAMVAPEWVLTAAHCVTDGEGRATEPDEFVVVAGTAELTAGTGATTAVAEVVVHPTASERLGFDAALVRLAAATDAPAVPLAGVLEAGTTMVTTGWGRTLAYAPGETVDRVKSSKLKEVATPLREDGACVEAFGGNYEGATMLCVGGVVDGMGACQGDSGGPVFVADGAGGWLLAGLTSWGSGCGTAGYPDVATKASALGGWVEAVTGQGVLAVGVEPPLPPVRAAGAFPGGMTVVIPGLAQD